MLDIQIPPFKPIERFNVADFQQTVDWGLKAMGISGIWEKTTGKKALCFVLDTGIDRSHSDLQQNIEGGINLTDDGDYTAWDDVHGHGTHVAGIVAASANQWGVVGVAPNCRLFACKVLGDNGSGSSSWIANAINFAVDYRTSRRKIINLSLGSMTYSKEMHAAIKRAYENNIPIIAAAGNDGDRLGKISYPGRYAETFAIASYNTSGDISDFSQYGDKLDFAAPGEAIFSTVPGESYATYSGTSMASPFVSGIVALMVSIDPYMAVEQIRKRLIETALDLKTKGYDFKSGWGVVQPVQAIEGEVVTEPLFTLPEALRKAYRTVTAIRTKRKAEILHLCSLLGIDTSKRKNRKYYAELVWKAIN